MTLHINWMPPQVEMRRVDAGVKWCFRCRKHLRHDDVLTRDRDKTDDPELDYSYYDPAWHYECSGCGGEHVYFPGCGPL